VWLRGQTILLPVVALACAGAVVSGCTARQSQDEYEQRLERAVAVRDDVSARMNAHELETSADYDAASRRVGSALDELDADAPPRDLEDAHDRMVDGLDGLAALLQRLGRCEALAKASEQDRRACRQSIGQDTYDTIRNDFVEANTIYRQEGVSLPGLGSGGDAGPGEATDPEGGDEL
jgi:hypothetical protein